MTARRTPNLRPWTRGESGNARGSSRRARARAAARRLGLDVIAALLETSPAEIEDDDQRERWLDALRSSLSADDALELVFPVDLLLDLEDGDLAALERISDRVRQFHAERLAVQQHRTKERAS